MNSQCHSVQSHSINNSHSHTKVCRHRPMPEVNLEQIDSKQRVCSFLLQYHKIKVQTPTNLIWILHGGNAKCSKHFLLANTLLTSERGAAVTIGSAAFSQYAMVYSCRHPCQLPLTHTLHSTLKAPFLHSDSWKSLQKQDNHIRVRT